MSQIFSSALVAALLGASLAACGGHAPNPGDGNGDAGSDGGLIGSPCNFDTECSPPDSICDTVTNTCAAGCTVANNCPSGKVCNANTGRCIVGSGGDGGTTGTDGGAGAGAGTPSDTLCRACSLSSDCHGGGLCVSNAQHTGNFCTQDCTSAPCPTGFACTLDRTGTKHQCYPESGSCDGFVGGPDGGTTDGGTDAGPVNDPTVPSDNPNGCGFCGQCQVNNDCVTGSVCINGSCALGPCKSWVECALHGGILSRCTDVGLADKYCIPLLGQCIPLPGPLAPLGGDLSCQPQGTNPGCATPSIPSAGMGANVAVTQNLSPRPLLASEDSITRDSQGRMALGYIGVDSQGKSYMGVAQSLDDGAHWLDKGRMAATTGVQSDPVLVTSKWSDASGAHERMHYVWVGYTLTTSGGQPAPKDMFMESSFSDDGGATWSHGIQATTTTDNNNGVLLLDKPWIAVSPDASQTLILNFSVGDNSQQHMYAVISTDHGQSWQPKVSLENGDNNHGHNLGMPVFDPADPTGNTVYVVYVTYTQIAAGTSNSITLVKSTDRGAHWSLPLVVSAADDQVLFEPPSIAADRNHHLYVGYVGAAGSAGAAGARFWDSMVATLDTSGSTPVVAHRARASDDQAACFQHIHTMLQVDPVSGRVFAAWLDNRDGGKGGTYYAVSTDNGASFGSSRLVSDQPYIFNPDHQNAQLKFLGDYFGFLFDGTKLRFAWSDPRNGSDSQVFYAGGAP
jgi:hypothetical protein